MPWRTLYNRVTDWASLRTKLEITICAITLIAIIVIIILHDYDFRSKGTKEIVNSTANGCFTSNCLIHAAKFMRYTNTMVNPCENFFRFTCGYYARNSYDEEKMGPAETKMHDLLAIYNESIDENDHIMVRTSKKFFQTCIDEMSLEEEGLKTIKRIIGTLGGWPVLEGDKWSDKGFQWLDVTYKLRNLGFYYSVFFGLKPSPDPDNESRNIPRVYVEDVHQYSHEYKNLELVQYMTNIAILFGGRNYTQIEEEFMEVRNFINELQETEIKDRIQESFKYTILTYDTFGNPINWLEFINNILHPVAKVSPGDYVIFPSEKVTSKIFTVISATPTRTIANYMIWKMVESSLPFLTQKLRNFHTRYTKMGTHEQFCYTTIESMFPLSPMKIMLEIKGATPERTKILDEFLLAFKTKFLQTLTKNSALSMEVKEAVLEKVRTVALVSGIPSNHTAEGMLDELKVDMVQAKSESLLNLYGQINRNRESTVFKQLGEPKMDTLLWKLGRFNILEPSYLDRGHEIVLPTVIINTLRVYDDIPNYINYGILGATIGTQFAMILLYGNASETIFPKEADSIRKRLDHEKFGKREMRALGQQIFSEKLSYEVYQDWVKKHGEEDVLVYMNYTQNQLFWMSYATSFCYFAYTDIRINALPWHTRLAKILISDSLHASSDFIKDFNCS